MSRRRHQLQVSVHGRLAPEDPHEALTRAVLHVRPSRAAVTHDHRSAGVMAAKLHSESLGCFLAHYTVNFITAGPAILCKLRPLDSTVWWAGAVINPSSLAEACRLQPAG